MVGTGDNLMIGGFIVTGEGPRTVAVRGLGRSLAQAGLHGTLADPVLELRDGSGGLIARNDSWQNSGGATLPPAHPEECLIEAELLPGAYTVLMTGAGNGSGLGLVEIYDLGGAAGSELANLSTRGLIGSADEVLIAGLIVQGAGVNTKVAVRARGPSLAQSGLAGVLADPQLEVRNAQGALLAANDNWRDAQETELLAAAINPPGDEEAALITWLAPGGYTALVRGAGGGTGLGLVELFQLR